MIETPTPRHDDPEIIEQPYLLWYLGAVERDESEYTTQIYTQQRNWATFWQVVGENHPDVQKLTLSTALAQAAKKVEQKLPPQWPFGHAIDLKDTFTLR